MREDLQRLREEIKLLREEVRRATNGRIIEVGGLRSQDEDITEVEIFGRKKNMA